MKDRIKQIIENENISYSKFADLLGIQRSGISHIINGRNKPSLEIIQKILETFNYINTEWLLFGRGSMKNENFTEIQGNLFQQNISKEIEPEDVKDDIEGNNSKSEAKIEDSKDTDKILSSAKDNLDEKRIERVLIFYSDKTFKDYSPEKEV